MENDSFKKAAEQLDSAFRIHASHLKKQHSANIFKSVLRFFVGILILFLLGYGVYLLFVFFTAPSIVIQPEQQVVEVIETPIVFEQPVQNFSQPQNIDVSVSDAVVEKLLLVVDAPNTVQDIMKSIFTEPTLHVYRRPIEGFLHGYNLSLSIAQPPATRPLAVNRLRGATDGALGAVYSSLGFTEIDKELIGTQTGNLGIALGTELGQPIPDPLTLEAKTQLLTRIDNILSLDPSAVMETGFNREQTYHTYLLELKNLFDISEKVSADIATEITDLNNRIIAKTREKDLAQNTLSEDTQSLSTQGLENRLQTFNKISSELAALQSRQKVLSDLAKFYSERLKQLTLRIQGVEGNKDALIKGVKFLPVEGSGVDLLQSK